MTVREEFPIPDGMSPEEVAKELNGHLLHHKGVRLSKKAVENNEYGPYRKDEKRDLDWQLDGSNDYWLHIRGTEAWVGCRYPNQKVAVMVIVERFKKEHWLD